MINFCIKKEYVHGMKELLLHVVHAREASAQSPDGSGLDDTESVA